MKRFYPEKGRQLPYKFDFFFVSLIRQGKIKFYNAAVRCFLKLLENLQGKFCDGDRF